MHGIPDGFLRAHGQLSRGVMPEEPRAWMFKIARNLIVDTGRADRRRDRLNEALELAVEAPESGLDGSAFALAARLLPPFIERLPDPYRRAVSLTELRGLTHAEAAACEGVSLSAMKSRVRRGRQMLLEALQRCCRFDLDARGHVLDFAPHSPCPPRASPSEASLIARNGTLLRGSGSRGRGGLG